MNLSLSALRIVVYLIMLAFCALSLAGCGGGGDDTKDSTAGTTWVAVSATSSGTTKASLSGTAWINNKYYASTCVGLGCFIDTQRTNDFPGVTVSCQNLTTGASGTAVSYYGPGTNWQHEWQASVPIASGNNTILISALDPDSKGGSITVDVTGKPPISVLSTTPLSGAADVFPNTAISATFSENIDQNRSSFTLQGPTGAVAGVRSTNGSTVTFTPSTLLAYGSTYTVTLPTTLLSQSGASLVSDYSWTFSTMATPVFYVVSTYPADKATGVTSNLWSVSATFSRDIDPNTVSNNKFFVSGPTGALFGSLSLNKADIAFNIADTLSANTTYTATLKAGISDTSGNALPFDYSWTFTTGN